MTKYLDPIIILVEGPRFLEEEITYLPLVKFAYLHSCIESTAADIDAMTENARPITLKTFLHRCQARALLHNLGYSVGRHTRGMRIQHDYAVSFYKSTYRGQSCYYMDHSHIEYIFTERGNS
jgi:hypothetical protein